MSPAARAYYNRRTGEVERRQTFAVPLADALRTLDIDALVWTANELVQRWPERAERVFGHRAAVISAGFGGAWVRHPGAWSVCIGPDELRDLVARMAREDG